MSWSIKRFCAHCEDLSDGGVFVIFASMKRLIAIIILLAESIMVGRAQEKLAVYDETVDVNVQIDRALAQAKQEGKFVVCQVGGNWCPWCLKFAEFIAADKDVSQVVEDNYVYIHVNYNPRKATSEGDKAKAAKMMKRLGNPGRFGFPVLVILDWKGKVVHIQDSALLEEGNGYNKEKVLRFFKLWTPEVS